LRCKNECLGLGSWIAPDEGPGCAPSGKPKKRRVRGADLRALVFSLHSTLTLRGRVAAKDHTCARRSPARAVVRVDAVRAVIMG
jgi:hypothetical protein